MRRERKRRREPAARKSATPLTDPRKKTLSLKERVGSLEARVQDLELLQGINRFPETIEKKPGPPPKISDEDPWRYRDALVDSLELYWPVLSPKLLRATKSDQIVAALVTYAGPESSRGLLFKRLIENVGALLAFLQSDRFHRKPSGQTVLDALNRPLEDERRMKAAARLPTRQIANAMAGVPELQWRTSLDKCLRMPSRLFIGKRTEDHYRELFKVPLPKRRKRQGEP